MSRVRDILRERELYFVDEDQSVAEVARYMASLNVGAILVLNDGRLQGIFSERDLMTRVVLGNRDPARTQVGEVMSRDIAAVDDSASLEEAMECMTRHGCRHLPVFRGTELAGFLSMRDVMHHELARKTEEIHQMRAYIHGQ